MRRLAERSLDLRLGAGAAAPLVVGFSGGGDSLALLLIAKAWADRAGRRLVALTLDHGLQPAAAEWARWCAERAARLGVEHRTLLWGGPKPAAGLPAAARAARHALLAEESRRLGAAVILLGHTADDVLEAAAMRAAGASTPSPRDWSPSPAWPQGRGVFLLRPLIGVRRAELRAWLQSHGERWIEDPANTDTRYARARARLSADVDAPAPIVCSASKPLRLARAFEEGLAGELRVPVAALAGGDPSEARAVLSAAILSAAGTSRPPRREALERLLARLRDTGAKALAGARVQSDGEVLTIGREAGEHRRRGAPEVSLEPDTPVVWDGRFEVACALPGRLRPLAGLIAGLPRAQAAALKAVAPPLRRALPAIVFEDGRVTCPILARDPQATARSLVMERFLAACGVIETEAAIWRVAKAGSAS